MTLEDSEDVGMFECFSSNIDDGIHHHIKRMNSLGFQTFASCSGLWRDHPDDTWLKHSSQRSTYVAFVRNDKITMDLLYRIVNIEWTVDITDNELFGMSITVRLPFYIKGGYSDSSIDDAWDALLEVLEEG